MEMKKLIEYGIAFGAGLAIGYAVFSKPVVTGRIVPQEAGIETRWTSGYHGPANGLYPEAGVAEMLYPYGQYHKMTGYSPFSTLTMAGNGGTIYID